MIESSIESNITMTPQERTFRAPQGFIAIRLGQATDGYPEVSATVDGIRFFAYRPARENAIADAIAVFEHTCNDAMQGKLNPGKSHHRPRQQEVVGPIVIAVAVAAIMAIIGTMGTEDESTGTKQVSIITGTR